MHAYITREIGIDGVMGFALLFPPILFSSQGCPNRLSERFAISSLRSAIRAMNWLHSNQKSESVARLRLLVGIALLLTVPLSGCASRTYLSVRRKPWNPLAGPLQLLSRSGPKPTERTEQLLRRHDLEKQQERDPNGVLKKLQEEIGNEPNTEKMHAFAELAYIQGKKAQNKGDQSQALNMFSASVAHAYMYLFSPQFDGRRNVYDPQFRRVCDLYNAALGDLLRIVNDQGKLRPGETYSLTSCDQRFDVRIETCGLWRADDFERFEFVSEFEVKGLVNRHVTYGLGVPLIAVRHQDASGDPASQFYPDGMSFPVTAVLRASEQPCDRQREKSVVTCVLELHDPLASDQVQLAGHFVPLESDLTTPLGYYLDNPEFQDSKIATWGLLNPNGASDMRGLYMLEAFDPNKIPVLMVHGLWSSPETWTEMVNDLRSLPGIRDRYQFWSYLYPTGQPFWISGTQLRQDLQHALNAVDPNRRWPALDQMVLVGHSMGGLVSRLQTVESGDDYWRILSDRPFEDLKADPETREKLAQTVFFRANPAIRRVITIGTPHRGSDFANDYTRWLGRKLIRLPAKLVQAKARIARDNPDFFRNTDLLTITTSIDSLSPDSPILPVMLRSKRAPWVKYHNIVGIVSEKNFLRKISEKGDGVVPYESAHLDDVVSEVVVESDHVHVHQHPLSILEVRRILLDHSDEMYAEVASQSAIPAAFRAPVPLPPIHGRRLPKPPPTPPTRFGITDTEPPRFSPSPRERQGIRR